MCSRGFVHLVVPQLAPGNRYTHVASGARIAWSRSGRVDGTVPTLVHVAHWMTHGEYDAVPPIFLTWLERLGREPRLVCLHAWSAAARELS